MQLPADGGCVPVDREWQAAVCDFVPSVDVMESSSVRQYVTANKGDIRVRRHFAAVPPPVH